MVVLQLHPCSTLHKGVPWRTLHQHSLMSQDPILLMELHHHSPTTSLHRCLDHLMIILRQGRMCWMTLLLLLTSPLTNPRLTCPRQTLPPLQHHHLTYQICWTFPLCQLCL